MYRLAYIFWHYYQSYAGVLKTHYLTFIVAVHLAAQVQTPWWKNQTDDSWNESEVIRQLPSNQSISVLSEQTLSQIL